jgi:hypothetical protein
MGEREQHGDERDDRGTDQEQQRLIRRGRRDGDHRYDPHEEDDRDEDSEDPC